MNGDALPLLSTSAGRWGTAVLILADVLAFASIWHSRAHSSKTKTLWTAIVAFLPVVGALGWFALGKGRGVRRV
jgi:hypothetical protein